MSEDSGLAQENRGAIPFQAVYGLVQRSDIDDVTQIYLENFPQQVHRWFRNANVAKPFYRDLMNWMRLAYGDTFFVARDGVRLAGYLILVLPHVGLMRALFRERLGPTLVGRAVAGQYGFSLAMLTRTAQAILKRDRSMGNGLQSSPHIYVVAVAKPYTCRGIGSALLNLARHACQESYDRMWLQVDTDNHNAIRLYERVGFRIVETSGPQHAMVWQFAAAGGREPFAT